MTISEPATMLTDYALTAASFFFAVRLRQILRRRRARSIQLWAIGFILSAVAAAVGGTFHGFAFYFTPTTSKTLWNTTVFLLGACSAFMVAGTLVASIDRHSEAARWLLTGLAISMLGLTLLATGVRLHEHFNRNDIYHCVQAVALYFFYRGARQLRDHSGRKCE